MKQTAQTKYEWPKIKRLKIWQIVAIVLSPFFIFIVYFAWGLMQMGDLMALEPAPITEMSMASPGGKYIATLRNEDADDYITIRNHLSSQDWRTLPRFIVADDGAVTDIHWINDKTLMVTLTKGAGFDPKPSTWNDVRILYRQIGTKIAL